MSRPEIAALLSALIPGLGQIRLGATRRGVLIALPFVGLIAVAIAAAIIDPKGALKIVLSAGVIVLVLVLVVAMAVYHLTAVLDAFRLGLRMRGAKDPRLSRGRALGSPLFLVAFAGVIGFYGVIEFVGVRAYQASQAIFVNPSSGFGVPAASFAPRSSPTGSGGPTGPATTAAPPTASPFPGPPWAADGRLNLLLIGSDAGPGRWLARTDTMIVLSVDIVSGRAALFGIPRNIINVPLPPESAKAFANGRFPQFLNALYVYATQHPKDFPGGDARGFRAVTGAIQELVGVPLDGAVIVNLNGFVALVDAVGGLWVDVPHALYDQHYPLPNGRGYIQIAIPAGCHKLSGERALEYARSRHMDSDYGRMQRQQGVLVSLARQLDPIALLSRVPELLDVAQENLLITVPMDQIADMAALAARVNASGIQTIQFSPPKYPEFLNTKSIQRIRDRVATVFDVPTASATPTATAPRPTPGPTSKPCPKP